MLRTRSDTYPVYNNRTRVVARPNHTFYPEQRISATYKLQLKVDQDLVDEDYYDEEIGVTRPEFILGHHRSDEATVVTHGSLLNFVLPDTILKPQTSNIAEVFPKSQLYLMPYLCERKNIEAKMGEMFERQHYQLKDAYVDTDFYDAANNDSHDFFEEKHADGSEFVFIPHDTHVRVNSDLLYEPAQYSMFHLKTVNLAGVSDVRNIIAQNPAAVVQIDGEQKIYTPAGDARPKGNPNAVQSGFIKLKDGKIQSALELKVI